MKDLNYLIKLLENEVSDDLFWKWAQEWYNPFDEVGNYFCDLIMKDAKDVREVISELLKFVSDSKTPDLENALSIFDENDENQLDSIVSDLLSMIGWGDESKDEFWDWFSIWGDAYKINEFWNWFKTIGKRDKVMNVVSSWESGIDFEDDIVFLENNLDKINKEDYLLWRMSKD